MGRFDIFKTTLANADKNEWNEPENMGYPINSPDDDSYFPPVRKTEADGITPA